MNTRTHAGARHVAARAVCVALLADPTAAAPQDGRVSAFTGVAYSGDVVPNYSWYGDMAIDLASIQMPAGDIPVLLNHDPNKIVGRARLSNDGKSLTVVDGRFSGVTDFGKEVSATMAEGHPWKLSIAVNGRSTQQDRAKPVKLNGRSLVVDCVMRNARLIEFSFVPSGADPNAYAAQLSSRLGIQPPSGDDMDPEQRIAELEAQVATLTGQVTTLTTERDTAVTALATERLAVRNAAIVALFGEQHGLTEAQLAVYRSMSVEQFAETQRIALAARSNGDNPLFRQIANNGVDPDAAAAAKSFSAPAGYNADPAQAQLHAKALKYQAEHPGTEYLAAVNAVAV